MRPLFAWLYSPLFLFGFLALALWTTAQHSPYWLVVFLVLAIALSFLAEAWLPYEPQWNRPRGDLLRDGLHALFNETLNLLGIAAIPLAAAWIPNAGVWPHHWPLPLQLLLAILIADFGVTLMHYLSHRIEPLWRLHAVHHSVQRMYGFNGLMKHPLHQTVEALAGTAPLLLMGMPLPVAALLAFAIALQLLLQHSNVDMRIGPLRHLFAWAPVHRFHHMKYGRAGDVNFALFFCFWDRLLGTAFHSEYRMGVDDLGIGSRPDYPCDYLAQMAEPFRAQDHGASPEAPAGLRGA
ncbi:sterol desaturase family protein [Pseudomonas sp. BN414]|uniref:sterol desaturase family protein n=1 Tax=Pseudomonas sp. BN414 TaxID=2567888 RepID=UPI0024552A5E|nr:sterol desaturase family protein [Pseudomonas sp. BN414]MDH4569312.1 sterol desaturase family protein [Pseudomonas sp. BN414]